MTKEARRQYGSGSVFQRADGRWVGRAEAGWTASGNRRRVTVIAATEAEAKRRLRDRIRDLDRGVTVSSRLTVKAFADQWLAAKVDAVRPKTYAAHLGAVKNWIVPTIGNRRLDQLGAKDVRAIAAAIRAAGRSDSTAVRAHAVLSAMLTDAEREGHTVPRAATLARPPAKGRPERGAIPTVDAVALLKVAAGDVDGSRWAAALLEGVRQAEALGLTWDMLDLDAGLIDVSWQLQAIPYAHGCGTPATCGRRFGGDCPERRRRVPAGFEMRPLDGALCLTRPKTAAGQRIIPVVPWMADALAAWRAKCPASPHGLVWPREDGRPQDPKQDRAAWVDLQRRAGVRSRFVTEKYPAGRPFELHEARHTTATLLAEAGVDPTAIQAILGHSSVIAQEAYKHARTDHLRVAMAEVAERLALTA